VRTRGNKIVVFEGDESDVGQLVNLGIVHSTGFSLTGMKGSTAASCQFAAMGELQPPIAANS